MTHVKHDALPSLYQTRFSEREQRQKAEIWRVLCRHFFQRYVRDTDAVLDLGAGYCEFINNIRCATKIAVDLNPDTRRHADPDVRVLPRLSTDLGELASDGIDVIFASNFFEHLPSKDVFLATLAEAHRVLRSGTGRLLILQPNIRFLHGEYWDFVDHHLPLTDRTLVEALLLSGFNPVEVRPRFLPYTTKSRFPQHPALVRLYLSCRPAHWLLGKQAWVVGVKK